MNNQIVAGLHDVQGHRPSHGAQSDKCNFQRIILSISAGIMRRFRHFGGFGIGDRSRADSSGPEKAPVWSPTRPERDKTAVTLLKNLYFPVSEHT
jgi:hypothetical protein